MSTTRLSAFASATSTVRLGTGILPVFARTPGLTAMTTLGMDIISGSRFTLGLGVGHRGSAEGTHGVAFRRPMTRIRETVEVVRQLLNGDRVNYQGRVFNVKDGSLGFGGQCNVPIYIAALGPQMIELAGEMADRVLLNWAAPSYVERAMEHLDIGAARAGRDLEEIRVACYIRVAVTPDRNLVRTPLIQQILRYCGMEYYRNFFADTGFPDEAEAIGRYLRRATGRRWQGPSPTTCSARWRSSAGWTTAVRRFSAGETWASRCPSEPPSPPAGRSTPTTPP